MPRLQIAAVKPVVPYVSLECSSLIKPKVGRFFYLKISGAGVALELVTIGLAYFVPLVQKNA